MLPKASLGRILPRVAAPILLIQFGGRRVSLADSERLLDDIQQCLLHTVRLHHCDKDRAESGCTDSTDGVLHGAHTGIIHPERLSPPVDKICAGEEALHEG